MRPGRSQDICTWSGMSNADGLPEKCANFRIDTAREQKVERDAIRAFISGFFNLDWLPWQFTTVLR